MCVLGLHPYSSPLRINLAPLSIANPYIYPVLILSSGWSVRECGCFMLQPCTLHRRIQNEYEQLYLISECTLDECEQLVCQVSQRQVIGIQHPAPTGHLETRCRPHRLAPDLLQQYPVCSIHSNAAQSLIQAGSPTLYNPTPRRVDRHAAAQPAYPSPSSRTMP
jgi:hypothetical protein